MTDFEAHNNQSVSWWSEINFFQCFFCHVCVYVHLFVGWLERSAKTHRDALKLCMHIFRKNGKMHVWNGLELESGRKRRRARIVGTDKGLILSLASAGVQRYCLFSVLSTISVFRWLGILFAFFTPFSQLTAYSVGQCCCCLLVRCYC